MSANAQPTAKETTSSICARLNDDCRWLRGPRDNYKNVMTMGVQALLRDDSFPTQIIRQAALMNAIRGYEFKDGDGEERDFGSFTFMEEMLFFKIDYYDRELKFGSEDPANASITMRVMTIMLASEY
jgi:hypothetical protein